MSRWSQIGLGAFVAWIVLLAASCGMPRHAVTSSPDSTSTVYLVRHGWHAGLVVRTADLPPESLPSLPGMRSSPYVEVGWGEESYYPSPDPGVGTLLKAGLWPTGSVLHVVPLDGPPARSYPNSRRIRLDVSRLEMEALARFIRLSFEVDDGAAVPAASGYYAGSRFYRSTLTYHAFNNCNHWAAFALRAAGCDTSPRRAITVGRLLRQAEACATEGR